MGGHRRRHGVRHGSLGYQRHRHVVAKEEPSHVWSCDFGDGIYWFRGALHRSAGALQLLINNFDSPAAGRDFSGWDKCTVSPVSLGREWQLACHLFNDVLYQQHQCNWPFPGRFLRLRVASRSPWPGNGSS